MIQREHALPIKRQAELAGISRGNEYYLTRSASPADQRLMKRIDAIHLEYPFAGSRRLRDLLNREGFEVGRRHVATLMQRMGIEAHPFQGLLARACLSTRAVEKWARAVGASTYPLGLLILGPRLWVVRRLGSMRRASSAVAGRSNAGRAVSAIAVGMPVTRAPPRTRTCPIKAYGSYLGYLTAIRSSSHG